MKKKLTSFLIFACLVFVFGGTARASSITFTEIPGAYTLTSANWNGSTFATGGNDANGNAFAFQNGILTNLDMSNFVHVGVEGAVGNYYVANAVLSNFTTEGVIYSSTGSIVSTYTNLGFNTVANNSEFGATDAAGQAVYGYVDATGRVTSLQTVSLSGTENSADALGVAGKAIAGTAFTNNSSNKAFLSINGVQQSLDTGVQSDALGVDASTNLALGQRNGLAGWWSANGAFNAIPAASGGGFISGEIISGYGGIFTVKDNQGNLWISNGIITESFAAYTNLLGVSITSIPSDAFFVGNAGQSSLVFEGSIAFATGPTSSFAAALDPPTTITQTATTPEPRTLALLGVGLTLIILAALRRNSAAGFW